MGTLFDQSERDHFIVNFDEHEELCERFGATSAMEKLKVFEIMEYSRRTDALIDNGDRWDEQIGGIGEILKDISVVMDMMKVAYNENREWKVMMSTQNGDTNLRDTE